MTNITPKQAITLLANGWDERPTARRDIAELILRMKTVVENAAQVSLDMCEGCDLSPGECAGEMFRNIACPNKALIDSIKAVKL